MGSSETVVDTNTKPEDIVDVSTPSIGVDSLYAQQQDQIKHMRATMLSISNDNNPRSVKNAIQNITVLRIYHQISRIIRFTEQMDKIEDKLYESIDASMENMEDTDPRTWMSLLKIQDQLQKTMIESQKLLDPYLNSKVFESVEIPQDTTSEESFATKILDQSSREKIRQSAQQVLNILSETDKEEQKVSDKNSEDEAKTKDTETEDTESTLEEESQDPEEISAAQKVAQSLINSIEENND